MIPFILAGKVLSLIKKSIDRKTAASPGANTTGPDSAISSVHSIPEEVRSKNWQIGDYRILSQKPSVISDADLVYSYNVALPAFLRFWTALEQATGYRWKNTSYIRDSPSHRRGIAFDLAPDIDPKFASFYGPNRGSDPVLYKRAPFMRALLSLSNTDFVQLPSGEHLGAFVEPDHIHLQVIPDSPAVVVSTPVVRWKIPKPIYPDTYERMKLPMTETAYS